MSIILDKNTSFLSIILDNIELIKKIDIIDRDYYFESNMNYVLIGLRRNGKTSMLYKRIKDSYCIFDIKNYYYSFVDKESNPKYYFNDNGMLNLFLFDKDTRLLENCVALTLKNRYEELFYLKSNKTKIDIDFVVPSQKQIYQVCYDINDMDVYQRKIKSILAFAKKEKDYKYFIISFHVSKNIIIENVNISIVSIKDFLLSNC